MAANKQPFVINQKDVTHLVVVAVATVLLVTAMFAPWWTRGYTIDHGSDATPEQKAMEGPSGFIDTITVSYYPFVTPSFGPFQFDSIREIAVTVTGIALVLCAVFVMAHNLTRWGIRTGRINASPGLPIKFAIASFWLGLIGVGSVLLWPFLGQNIEGIYSFDQLFPPDGFEGGEDGPVTVIKEAEYLNVGFYVGILGFIAYPAYLWINAASVRQAQLDAEGTGTTKSTTAY